MSFFMVLVLSMPARAHIPVIYTATPDDDWCQIVADALGGDYIMLTPGDYVGPCDITAEVSKPEGEVTILQSFDANNLARLVHDGVSDYILRVSGPGVFNVLQVEFGPVPAGVDAVRVGDGNDLMVRYNTFSSGDGRGVVQEGPVELLRVLDNRFVAPSGDPIVMDCPACGLGRFEVDGNVVEGGRGAIVVASDAEGQVNDNTIAEHEGTPLQLAVPAASVERNFVEGMADVEAAAVVNNIVVGDAVVAADSVIHNDLLAAVDVSASGRVEANVTLGVDLGSDNVSCDPSCFADLDARDYFPVDGSPLRGAAPWSAEAPVDFCGNGRDDPTAAGAVEAIGTGFGPVEITYRALANCRPDESTTETGGDTGATDTPDGTGGSDTGSPATDATTADLQVQDKKGCGCHTGPGAAHPTVPWLLAWGLPWGMVRRRSLRD